MPETRKRVLRSGDPIIVRYTFAANHSARVGADVFEGDSWLWAVEDIDGKPDALRYQALVSMCDRDPSVPLPRTEPMFDADAGSPA